MHVAEPYLDTSALAKRYIDEAGPDDFDAFLAKWPHARISRLAVVEFRCLLQRRRRAREIDAAYERAALADFAADIGCGYLEIEPLIDRHAVVARQLIDRLIGHSLCTLDALHLAIAQSVGASVLATTDQQMVRAARALGMTTVTFG
jgi:predicted nucleic acid-binding protein